MAKKQTEVKPSAADVLLADRFNLSDEYWGRLSQEHKDQYKLIRPMRGSAYAIEIHVNGLERALADYDKDMRAQGGTFEVNPDFQRGHVWSQEKQVAYVESLMRGTAPVNILFNCAGWLSSLSRNAVKGDLGLNDMVCVDGLQRLTAVRAFLADDFTIFGGHTAESLKGGPFDVRRKHLRFTIYDFKTRVDLLQFYIDLNSGGVVHTEAELARVRSLLVEENPDAAALGSPSI
jgi:hypothetical protein